VHKAHRSRATDEAVEVDGNGRPMDASFLKGERDNDTNSLSHQVLSSLETEVIIDNIEKLGTLDSYERRALSRRRKAAFTLLLAFDLARLRTGRG
jgi:hypothetical protein